MLRRKLLLLLGSLVVMLLIGAVGAILALQRVLDDVTSATAFGVEHTAQLNALSNTLVEIEAGLGVWPREPARGAQLVRGVRQFRQETLSLVVPDDASPSVTRAKANLVALAERLQAGVERTGATDRAVDARDVDGMLEHVVAARAEAAELGVWGQTASRERLTRAVSRFRWTVIGLGLAYLLAINVAMLLLIRAAAIVLKPVDDLVEANRRLAREEFDHRMPVDRNDEFGELALATNRLAEQLQTNEERKLETLRQVGRTLSHELNNATAIISAQLELVGRRSADPHQVERLRHIRDALGRMTTTVASLEDVRRIALTDYLQGVKMLDLERSTAEDPADAAVVITRPHGPTSGSRSGARDPGASAE